MAAEICEIAAAGERSDPRAGYGASASPARARSHAAHELVERTLVRKWWAGRLRPVTPSRGGAASLEEALGAWGRPTDRTEHFMQLRHHGLPPVHVAWSVRLDGSGFVFGAACRPSVGDAAKAALRELRQMVFGLGIAARRARNGRPLPKADLARLRRARKLDPRHRALLDPAHSDAEATNAPLTDDAEDIVARFGAAGLAITIADITPIGSSMHVFEAAAVAAGPLAEDDPYFAE
jgi:ribosomal protein S12 methylthiotransferase accessory factor YcaO